MDDPDEQVRDRVVELYLEGKRVVDITQATGYSRPQVYWILRQRGVVPNRQKGGAAREPASTMELIEALAAAERENGRLQAEVERLQAMLDEA